MLTQRLGSSTQKDDAFIDSLLTAIEEHPGSCDEVWLASDYGFPPLEKHRASAEKLKKIAEKFRQKEIRVSLQISNTIGHGQYMSARDCSGLVYEGSPVEKMVGPGWPGGRLLLLLEWPKLSSLCPGRGQTVRAAASSLCLGRR